MTPIQELQRDIYNNYQKELKLDANAKYMHGTLLKPVVPLDNGS